MPISPTRYQLVCDVNGCGKQLEGTVDQLSRQGWMMKLLYGGQPTLEPIRTFLDSAHADYPANVICPICKAQGNEKTMVKK